MANGNGGSMPTGKMVDLLFRALILFVSAAMGFVTVELRALRSDMVDHEKIPGHAVMVERQRQDHRHVTEALTRIEDKVDKGLNGKH